MYMSPFYSEIFYSEIELEMWWVMAAVAVLFGIFMNGVINARPGLPIHEKCAVVTGPEHMYILSCSSEALPPFS